MNKAFLLFSGGIDSTYTAVKLADKYDKLILITYRTPGMINLHLAEQTARKIKNLFRDKIEHRTIDIREYISLSRGNIIKCIADNLKYHFFYSWCLGCKLGMHLRTIELCHQEGINTVLDGSNIYDSHALEQHKECEDFFETLYTENGIKFLSPFYNESNETKEISGYRRFLSKIGLYKPPTAKKVEYLKNAGIDIGASFVSQYRTIQPSCTISLFFNLPRIVLKFFFKEKSVGYLTYLRNTCANYKENTH